MTETYQSLWRGQVASPGPPRPTMQTIIERVAEKHRVSVAALKGPARCKAVSIPRQEAMYEMKMIGRSFPQIGQFLGGRDHTTALHGYRAHMKRIAG